MRTLARIGLLVLAAAPFSGCGSSSTTGGSSSSPAAVQACLEKAGYGVTVVPASDVTASGGESRGPGQTGELLVGLHGARPHVGGDDAAAVVAFWDSHAHAAGSPNARDRALLTHADTLGKVTVQPTTQLALFAVRSARTPSGRRATFSAELKKIERCAS